MTMSGVDGGAVGAPGPARARIGGVAVAGSLGDYLRAVRRELSLSLREVESRSGVSNAYVSQLEAGRACKPSPDVLRQLAVAYGPDRYPEMLIRAGYLADDARPDGGRLARLSAPQRRHAAGLVRVALAAVSAANREFAAAAVGPASRLVRDELRALLERLEADRPMPSRGEGP
jgi:transcriptional regulator with XRE-family HTH domain